MTEQKLSTGMPEQPIIQPSEFDPEDEYRPEPEPQPPSWMDGSLRIGIHTSIVGSYLNALESARKLGCNALQIFSASPRMWQGETARIPDVDAQAFRARREEVGEILAGLRNLPVGACLDTAHLFAAGYDIKTEGGLASTIGQIDGAIGLENVPVIHMNDSKIPLGGRVDRHEHIGKGKIGAEALARILRHPRFGAAAPEGLTGRAFVAETPIDDPGDDRRNVAALWELAGLQEQAPEAEKGFSMLTPALKKKISENRKMEKKRKDNTETLRTQRFAGNRTRTRKSA